MLQEDEKKYIINTYNRQPGLTPMLVRGRGALAWDDTGKEYLDFLGGLAVNALGHAFQPVIDAAYAQMQKIMHTSNLFYTEPQIKLARSLVENGSAQKVFFCNSGAEANEGAIKLARKYTRMKTGSNRFEIITAYNSFHGRTLATITATGQQKFHRGFEPLLPGFSYAQFNNVDSFRSKITGQTCALMVEPVQGEGGVHLATSPFLQGLKELCHDHNLLLIFDEVQCGMGRTGKLFAHEHYGVTPDIITLAKALGGGLPIGAMLCSEEVATGFAPGDHASTFGGNPVACAASLAVLEEITKEGFLPHVSRKGAYFQEKLLLLKEKYPDLIKEVRGLGLIIGLEMTGRGKEVQKHCQEQGLLINCIGETVLRFLPPLNVTEEELNTALKILEEAIEAIEARRGEE